MWANIQYYEICPQRSASLTFNVPDWGVKYLFNICKKWFHIKIPFQVLQMQWFG